MKVLSKNSVMEFVKKTAILWVMIILILILSVISPSFFRGQNLLNIIKQASITGVIGVGMTFVLITGGIDLSVGSVMALSGTMAASVAVAEKNMPIALVSWSRTWGAVRTYKWNRCIIHWISAVYYDVGHDDDCKRDSPCFYKRNSDLRTI